MPKIINSNEDVLIDRFLTNPAELFMAIIELNIIKQAVFRYLELHFSNPEFDRLRGRYCIHAAEASSVRMFRRDDARDAFGG